MFVVIFQRLLFEALLDIVYFPVWWYTRGLVHSGQWAINFFLSGNNRLAPGLWLRNIFVPMFGQYDWRGRIISFFMRLLNVIGRGIALVFWTAFCLCLWLLWVIIPLVMFYSIYQSVNK